jgi:hypothetical protein
MTGGIVDWWRRRQWSTPHYKEIVHIPRMSQVPELPRRRTVVIVGTHDRPKWLVFACPCGHAHRIALNLAPSREPNWAIETDAGLITVRPSIDSLTTAAISG